MSNRIKLGIAGAVALGLPGAVHANEASSQINLDSTVMGSCGLGSPDITEIDLQDLTGPDGLLDPAKTGATVLGTATIADAWCNTAHKLTMQSQPMTLERVVSYAQPAYMARKVTFDAELTGWVLDFTSRPLGGGDLASYTVPHEQAAAAPGLQLNISNLETLSVGGSEQSGLMLEYGTYRGTVTITLAAVS